jgi:hypothetical protein
MDPTRAASLGVLGSLKKSLRELLMDPTRDKSLCVSAVFLPSPSS